MEEIKNYAKIEFNHFNLDYDYCICEFHDIKNQLEAIEAEFLDHEPSLLEADEIANEPRIVITIEPMIDSQYAEYLKICQEEND